jgi:hypothetical protein
VKRTLVIVSLLMAVIIAWWFLREDDAVEMEEKSSVEKNDASISLTKPSDIPPSRAAVILPVAVESSQLLDLQATAADDLAVLANLLQEYRRNHGGNPVGDNSEITAALRGTNPKNLGYLANDVASLIDRDGCLTDRWGQPYFFHAQSGQHMEIRSAGPDGILHNADDLLGE